MEAIFHEQQEGSLCAQHCLNSLLQGQFYSAVDLGELAAELDAMERRRMAEVGEDSPEYRAFLQQPSSNMDDSGFFSVQVISRALEVWGLHLLPLNSSDPLAVRAKQAPVSATSYICNYREHWFTIRRLGSQWFNLNSLLEGPELVSNSYLGEFLAQLQQEGYSIFLVTGGLPECDADLVLQAVPAVQAAPPRLLSDITSSGAGRAASATRAREAAVPGARGGEAAARDEAAELEAAMLMSLAETSGTGGQAAKLDTETLGQVLAMQRGGDLDQEEELAQALRLSQEQPLVPGVAEGELSEEDEMQRAIALSLEGGSVPAPAPAPAAAQAGWGERLAVQEREEERRWQEEQEKAAREEEEQLRQAMAMSMETSPAQPAPASRVPAPAQYQAPASQPAASPAASQPPASRPPIDPVQAAWPKQRNPAPGTLAAGGPQAMAPTSKAPQAPTSKAPQPGPSKAPQASPVKAPQASPAKAPQGSPSKAPQAPEGMPEGPGHTLGGGRPGGRGREDPQEIRRRRLAFLDSMEKKKKEEEKK